MSILSQISILMISLSLVACKGDKGKDKQPPAPTKAPETKPPETKPPETKPPADGLPALPLGLTVPTPSPEDNPSTADKVALGELLFFDTRLSDGGAFGCVNCHLPEKGWTDALPLSPKHDGKVNTRHSPALYNVAYATSWYWDGRKATLEDQILAAWTGQVGATPDKIAAALAAIPAYAERFQKAFGEGPTAANIPKALAAFLRIGLRSGNAPWDQYKAGDAAAVSADAIAGEAIFAGKAGCVACHAPPLYTDMAFHNVGVGYKGVKEPDVGRFATSKIERDTGAFKTPGLRGVSATGPFFHDGSAATLADAVDFMLGGGYREGNAHIDPLLKPVVLSADEKKQLIAFIESLTPQVDYQRPTLP